MIKIIDVRGKHWWVRRTSNRHYEASQDGLNFVRCSVKSIAIVRGIAVNLVRQMLGAKK